MRSSQTADPLIHPRQRWFVLTVGRSGSSLLCAILADAGADFGQQAPEDWDPRTGEMEHPGMLAAAHQLRRARDITEAGDFLFSPRLESAWRRRRARGIMRCALEQAQYFKSADLDLAIQPSFALGYLPQVILSYRAPEPSLQSLLVGRKRTTPDTLIADYVRVYRQGIALMQTFGGCVVSFDDLQGRDHGRSFKALAQCTGLDADALESSRAARCKALECPDVRTSPYPQAQGLFSSLNELRGQYFEPARATKRKLEALAAAAKKG